MKTILAVALVAIVSATAIGAASYRLSFGDETGYGFHQFGVGDIKLANDTRGDETGYG